MHLVDLVAVAVLEGSSKYFREKIHKRCMWHIGWDGEKEYGREYDIGK